MAPGADQQKPLAVERAPRPALVVQAAVGGNQHVDALRGEGLTGHRSQDKVHPNTHVNKAQSTNDTIPSATHLAIAPRLDRITADLDRLAESFEKKAGSSPRS
ncbi:hypothetical protein HMPREF9440_01381 [Sutterella parvirubra YIT 11816]|uniref:Fumarate lyase N-terminal domain-containing protein n=1 Tax=Sutterella parvirubra YIT 11816 TaxID=762967 RepID=H3KF63_9BURK|nr:hypothetical protein HMPREF9440_01381 [Sutterella parvirubra YIT 11816]